MTMTAAEVNVQFMTELQALLNKWGAELDAKNHWQGHPECGEDIRMTVIIPAIYTDIETEREWTEIDLGSWMSSK